MPESPRDTTFMQRCLHLAAKGRGSVRPNPMVGCVITDGRSRVLAEGWHREWGGPHAEVDALDRFRAEYGDRSLSEATLYVNLEPCNHQGKTPPCSERVVAEGVGRVVIGARDPNPQVDGGGIRRLREAGIEVAVGVEREACEALNAGFGHWMTTGRPLVTAKIAQTLDGFTAPLTGTSRWISGEESRVRVHAMRRDADAVLVGSGTALADDPALTLRYVQGAQPLRVVLDREASLPKSLALFSDEHAGRTVSVVGEGAPDPGRLGPTLRVPLVQEKLDLGAMLDRLAAPGIPDGRAVRSVLVEPGPRLLGALLGAGLVDRLVVFVAPILLGRGRPAVNGWGAERLADALRASDVRHEPVGDDIMITLNLR